METSTLKFQNLPSHSIFAGKPPELLYHYTTLDGAHKKKQGALYNYL